MTIAELLEVLSGLDPAGEVRLGDEIEAGPFLHAPCGGVWKVATGVVLCADPDADLVEEDPHSELPFLWRAW